MLNITINYAQNKINLSKNTLNHHQKQYQGFFFKILKISARLSIKFVKFASQNLFKTLFMEKLLFSKDEDKCPYRAEFKPIENYSEVISDFEQMYESHGPESLFQISGIDEIVLIAETSALNFIIDDVFDPIEYYDDYSAKISEVKGILNKNNVSALGIEVISSMISEEDFSLDQLINKIALPDQTITIQISDLTYGNTEYTIDT